MNLRSIADSLIEVPIVTSFTNIGYATRSRLAGWTSLDDYDLEGRVIVLTGATSGLGLAAARQFATCGATLVLVGRNAERNESVVADLIEATGNAAIGQVAADMGGAHRVVVRRCGDLCFVSSGHVPQIEFFPAAGQRESRVDHPIP